MQIFISLAGTEDEIRADKKKVEREHALKQKVRRFEEQDEPEVARATERSDLDDAECSN